ncbi:MFS general substrate transporter [Hypoxylon sp. FL0890]|nr:MFS general substrate transporter [Hypoxylon sp. FL0890]
MWSYVQYRRIGRDLQRLANKEPKIARSQKGQDLVSDDLEAPKADSYPLSTLESKGNGHATARCRGEDRIVLRVEGDDDPLGPKNWPLTARCKNIAILSFLIFAQAWAGAAEPMANKTASAEFGVSQVAENLSTAMYLFGIGSGALFAGPLFETVGRNPTYLVSTFCYLFFVLGSALTPTFRGQVVCRFLVGLFSSATLSINGSSGPIIAWANVAAPAIAPIAGGWIVTLIISSLAFLVSFLFLPEMRITGDSRYVSEHAESASFIRKLRQVGPLPAKFLTQEPVIAVFGGYLTLLYILLFTFLSGFDYIFKETYQLSTALTGSYFASIAAGATFFTLLAPGLYSWARWETEFVRGSSIEPEFRLWPALVAAPDSGACFVFGMVIIAIYVSSYEYIIDGSYEDHSAIGLASITILRYLVAGGMVMAVRPMYGGIGTHWTMTLLGCIAVMLLPAPLAFWRYGRKLRSRSPYANGPDD